MPITSLFLKVPIDVPLDFTEEQAKRPMDHASTLPDLLVDLPPLGETSYVVGEIVVTILANEGK